LNFAQHGGVFYVFYHFIRRRIGRIDIKACGQCLAILGIPGKKKRNDRASLDGLVAVDMNPSQSRTIKEDL